MAQAYIAAGSTLPRLFTEISSFFTAPRNENTFISALPSTYSKGKAR
jgi:hypothetical protein